MHELACSSPVPSSPIPRQCPLQKCHFLASGTLMLLNHQPQCFRAVMQVLPAPSCPGRADRPEGRGKQARQQTDGQITDSRPVVRKRSPQGRAPTANGTVITRGPGICGGRKRDSPMERPGRSEESLCISLRAGSHHRTRRTRAYRRQKAVLPAWRLDV